MRRLSRNFRRRQSPFSHTRERRGRSKTLHPQLTAGRYRPFAPTLFDYINRAMPMPAPHALSADDVYALTAYIPNLDDLVPDEFVADGDGSPMQSRHNPLETP
jgi:cytochrome c